MRSHETLSQTSQGPLISASTQLLSASVVVHNKETEITVTNTQSAVVGARIEFGARGGVNPQNTCSLAPVVTTQPLSQPSLAVQSEHKITTQSRLTGHLTAS